MSYLQEANRYYQNKQYEKALKYYHLDYNETGDTRNLYNIGVCYIKLKTYEDAIGFLKMAIKDDFINSQKAFYNLGFCYAMLKDNKKALIYFKSALALDNDDSDSKKSVDMLWNTIMRDNGIDIQEMKTNKLSYLVKKEIKTVCYFHKNRGFEIVTYIYDNNNDYTETVMETIDCKKIGTKKYDSIVDKLNKKYKIDNFVIA